MRRRSSAPLLLVAFACVQPAGQDLRVVPGQNAPVRREQAEGYERTAFAQRAASDLACKEVTLTKRREVIHAIGCGKSGMYMRSYRNTDVEGVAAMEVVDIGGTAPGALSPMGQNGVRRASREISDAPRDVEAGTQARMNNRSRDGHVWVMRVPSLALLSLLVAGCTSTAGPFVTSPRRPSCVAVRWSHGRIPTP